MCNGKMHKAWRKREITIKLYSYNFYKFTFFIQHWLNCNDGGLGLPPTFLPHYIFCKEFSNPFHFIEKQMPPYTLIKMWCVVKSFFLLVPSSLPELANHTYVLAIIIVILGYLVYWEEDKERKWQGNEKTF